MPVEDLSSARLSTEGRCSLPPTPLSSPSSPNEGHGGCWSDSSRHEGFRGRVPPEEVACLLENSGSLLGESLESANNMNFFILVETKGEKVMHAEEEQCLSRADTAGIQT